MTGEDRQFNPLPLSGLGALQPFNGCLATGAAFVGMERFNAQDALALLMDERCTVAFPAVDRLWASVLDQPEFEEADLSQLWLVAVDGDAELLAAIAEVTPDVTQVSVYGSTEAGGLIALSHPDDPLELRIDSAGRPFEGSSSRSSTRTPGRSSSPTRRARSPSAAGRSSRATRRREAVLYDGFGLTGDHGSLDESGRLFHLTSEREPLTPDEERAQRVAHALGVHAVGRRRQPGAPGRGQHRADGGSPSTAATGSGAPGGGSDSMRAKPARSA